MKIDIMNAKRDRNLKLCQHEASHAVTAYVLGFTVVGVEIKQQDLMLQGGAELNVFRPLSDITDVINYLSDRITVLQAGVIGENFLNSVYKKDAADELFKSPEGRSDRDKIDGFCSLLINLSSVTAENYKELLDQYNERLRLRTIELVSTNKAAILRLRDEMMAKINPASGAVRLSHGEIERCVQESRQQRGA